MEGVTEKKSEENRVGMFRLHQVGSHGRRDPSGSVEQATLISTQCAYIEKHTRPSSRFVTYT